MVSEPVRLRHNGEDEKVTQQPVGVEVVKPFVAVITIDRPPVNALNRQTREQFVAAVDALQERDDVHAIVLTARGHVFCAGADIKEKQALAASPVEYGRANRLIRDAFYCLLDSSKPVIAAVNGGALGAGFILASCCDMILASETAFFAMPEINVGQGGGASFLQRILPLPKLRRMILTGEHVPAAELYRLGAVEECLPPDQLLPRAIELASTIASKSPTAVKTIHDAFLTVEALPLREGFRHEQGYTTALSTSLDAEAARRAFFEKRSTS
jgi:enoyl-CoA hydratase